MEAQELTETVAENDLRAIAAAEAIELGQNANAMLELSDAELTKWQHVRGTQKTEPYRKNY